MAKRKDEIMTTQLVSCYHTEIKKYLEENPLLPLETLRDVHDQIASKLIKGFSEDMKLSSKDSRRQDFRKLLDENFKLYENEKYMSLNWTEHGVAMGIDLGTVNSVTGVYVNGKVKIIPSSFSDQNTPSCIAFTKDGKKVYGKSVESFQYKDPTNTLHDVKRLIGRNMKDVKLQKKIKNWQFSVLPDDEGLPKIIAMGKSYYPEEISAMLLAEFKRVAENYLRTPIKKAVITVPAYFNDDQRNATLEAGRLADLEVLSILSEPTAAAIAYKFLRFNEKARKVVIFDLGGGTFDVAVLNIKDDIDITSIGGDPYLGGIDFDIKLMNYCIEKFGMQNESIQNLLNSNDESSRRKKVRLLSKCEDAKKKLSFVESLPVFVDGILKNGADFEVDITRGEFEGLILDDLTKMMTIMAKTVKDAKVEVAEIDDIVLVGGATRIPKLQDMLKEFFLGKKLNVTIDPDQAVAYGAAMQAAILNGTKIADKNFNGIQDVTPMSFGIEVVDRGGVPQRFFIIIPKNSKYPVEKQNVFETAHDFQDMVDIRVYQGESEYVTNNFFVGEFRLSAIPFGKAGSQKIEVIMKITEMSVMRVEAICKSTGSSNSKILTVTKTRKT